MNPELFRKAQEILEETLGLSPAQRRRAVREACGGNELLEDEVRRLLEASDGMPADYLEPPARPQPLPRVVVGSHVSHYRILRRLGSGGMGEVFEAEDRRLKRRVALKVLPPDVAASRERLERFQREAEAVAALNHPNVITIHSIEELNGLRFLTMELVDGPSLGELLPSSGALPMDEFLDFGIQIATGLAEAHRAGIVHRDLKPGNVMIAPGGLVKILDFGLARLDREFDQSIGSTGPTRALTRDGAILGTISYMSPEQLKGQRVDARSDLFSLGILLYELATGTHPFADESEALVIAKILETEPLSPRTARPDLPAGVGRILERCLEKDAARRYSSSTELLEDLRRCRIDSSSSPASDASTAVIAAARPERRPTSRQVLVGVLTLVVAITVGVGFWIRRNATTESTDPKSLAVLPLRNNSPEPIESDYLAAGISQAVITKLTQVGLRVTPWTTASRYSGSEMPLEAIAAELGADSILEGSFQLVEDRILVTLSLVRADTGFQIWAAEIDEPFEDLFEVQRQIARRAVETLKGELTLAEERTVDAPASSSVDAYDFYLQGAHLFEEGDQESAQLALQYFERALELDPNLVEAYIGRGTVHFAHYFNSWGGGTQDLVRAEEAFLTALRLEPRSLRARRGLQHIAFERGSSQECLFQAREAARVGRRDDPETLMAVAQAYTLCGLPASAIPLLQRVIHLDPRNEAGHWYLVLALAWSEQLEAAISAGNAYLASFGDSEIVELLLGMSHASRGEPDLAREHLEEATPVVLGSPDPRLFLGYIVRRQGDEEEAQRLCREGLELARSRRERAPEDPRPRVLQATFETCLHGFPESDSLDELLEPSELNSIDFSFLAGALATEGHFEEAAEVLETTLERGLVHAAWRIFFRTLDVDLTAPKLVAFEEQYREAAGSLAERFRLADPVLPLSAR